MLFPSILFAEVSLYDELEFLNKASENVEVFLPGTKPVAEEEIFLEDSISTGQAGLLKKYLSPKKIITPSKNKKRLRYRSR